MSIRNDEENIQVYLLGPLRVFVDGSPLAANEWLGRKTRTLFRHLIHRRNAFIPEEQLMEAAWPEGDPDKVRHSLWARLSELRRILRDERKRDQPLIVHRPGGYVFHADPERVFVDADVRGKSPSSRPPDGSTADQARLRSPLDPALNIHTEW